MPADSRCPRCSGPFACGAHDDTPCACFAVHLTDAARAALRAAFTDCVCVACLRDVQAECDAQRDAAPFSASPPPGVR